MQSYYDGVSSFWFILLHLQCDPAPLSIFVVDGMRPGVKESGEVWFFFCALRGSFLLAFSGSALTVNRVDLLFVSLVFLSWDAVTGAHSV